MSEQFCNSVCLPDLNDAQLPTNKPINITWYKNYFPIDANLKLQLLPKTNDQLTCSETLSLYETTVKNTGSELITIPNLALNDTETSSPIFIRISSPNENNCIHAPKAFTLSSNSKALPPAQYPEVETSKPLSGWMVAGIALMGLLFLIAVMLCIYSRRRQQSTANKLGKETRTKMLQARRRDSIRSIENFATHQQPIQIRVEKQLPTPPPMVNSPFFKTDFFSGPVPSLEITSPTLARHVVVPGLEDVKIEEAIVPEQPVVIAEEQIQQILKEAEQQILEQEQTPTFNTPEFILEEADLESIGSKTIRMKWDTPKLSPEVDLAETVLAGYFNGDVNVNEEVGGDKNGEVLHRKVGGGVTKKGKRSRSRKRRV